MKLNGAALVRATVLNVWLITGMAVATEIYPAFKTFLTQIAGQHWTGKSIISAIAFFVFYYLFRTSNDSKGVFTGVFLVAASVVLGGLVIFLFYFQHFLAV